MKKENNFFILRHDVDSPFVYRKSRVKKILNRIFLANTQIPFKEKLPGYFEALKHTIKLEKKFNAKGTFFFRTVTSPTPNLVKNILNNGHEIAYHADRIDTLEDFQKDLEFIKNKTSCTILGFSKHGFAKRRSGGEWDEQKMIKFAISSKLKYLAQGVGHPDWETPKLVDGVYVFGHHLTIKDASMQKIEQYIESNKWPLLMLHPEDLFIDGVEDKFINILKKANAISVKNALEKMV